jgi:methyl-accepting chemotaxis protein
MSSGIQQVSQVVSTNAATSEESAAASEQLSSQASQLKEAVSVFKLKRGAMPGNQNGAAPAERRHAGTAVPAIPPARNISLGSGDFGKY